MRNRGHARSGDAAFATLGGGRGSEPLVIAAQPRRDDKGRFLYYVHKILEYFDLLIPLSKFGTVIHGDTSGCSRCLVDLKTKVEV